MGSNKYAHYDSDEYRLPEGFRRTAYDADTQVYTYTDAEGNEWEGAPGAQYGELRPVRTTSSPPSTTPESRATGQPMTRFEDRFPSVHEDEKASWRLMFPFFVLVGVFLMLVISITHWKSAGKAIPPQSPAACSDHARPHDVERGETCWKIAQHYETSVDEIIRENEGLDCEKLLAGSRICVPEGK